MDLKPDHNKYTVVRQDASPLQPRASTGRPTRGGTFRCAAGLGGSNGSGASGLGQVPAGHRNVRPLVPRPRRRRRPQRVAGGQRSAATGWSRRQESVSPGGATECSMPAFRRPSGAVPSRRPARSGGCASLATGYLLPAPPAPGDQGFTDINWGSPSECPAASFRAGPAPAASRGLPALPAAAC